MSPRWFLPNCPVTKLNFFKNSARIDSFPWRHFGDLGMPVVETPGWGYH
jgi:hypothetical protein